MGFNLIAAEPKSRKEVDPPRANWPEFNLAGQTMSTRPPSGDACGAGLCFILKDHWNYKQCVAIGEHRLSFPEL